MAVQTWLDGQEVTSVVLDGSSTRRLNRPSQATIRIPMQHAIGGPGSHLKISFDGLLHHHGTVLLCETDAGEDTGYTVYNSQDPMEIWRWRPARDHTGPTPGNFANPTFFERIKFGPQIMEEILSQSVDDDDPAEGEGDLLLQFGTFEGGGADLSGAPTNFPMSIAEVFNLLVNTGELDGIITPIDSGGDIGRLDCYNGDYGSDLSGSVALQYATGAHNARRIRVNEDMTDMVNKLWTYLGPKETINRWKRNITGTSTFPGNGGAAVTAKALASRAVYATRMLINIKDSRGNESSFIDLEKRLWLLESWIRAEPRFLAHITPVRGYPVGNFDIGDLISVQAGSIVRGGFSGVQRIYEYTASWDTEGVVEISELVTSATQEGF